MLKNALMILTVTLAMLLFQVPLSHAQNLEEGLNDLSNQITNGMSEQQKQKVAVIEFSDLDGKITDFGKYLSEELITRLFMTKKFEVVERQMLNKVIAEHKLNVSGIVDETTAKQLGKILGVDVICSGTITDLIDNVKINARLISTETGSVFAVAASQIQKDEVINKLMGKVSYIANTSQGVTEKVTVPGNVVFYEDFSQIEEGQIPQNWIGGEDLVVKKSERLRGKNVLGPFKEGKHSFTIPNLNIPNDFKLEFEIINNSCCCDPLTFNVGNLSFGLQNGASWLGDAKFSLSRNPDDVNKPNYFPVGEVILVSLEKIGAVFKLYINGRQISLIRKPDFPKPSSISFSYDGNNNSLFGIYKIVIYGL